MKVRENFRYINRTSEDIDFPGSWLSSIKRSGHWACFCNVACDI